VPGDRSRVTRRTCATTHVRLNTCTREHVHTHSRAQNCQLHLRREPSQTCCVLIRWWWSRQSLHLSNPLHVVQHWAEVDEWRQLVWRRLVCSRITEDFWTVCRFGRPEGSSIDGGYVSRTASGRRIAWSARVERRLV